MPQRNLWFPSVSPGGAAAPSHLGYQGDLFVSQLHGGKYAASYNNELFTGTNTAATVTSAALATTYTGLCLSNPAASGKNLALRAIGARLVVITAAVTSFSLITGFAAGGITAHTTPATVQAAIIGNSAAAAVGLLDAACTLVGTPAWGQALGGPGIAAGAGAFVFDFQAGLIIPPGGYVAIGSNIPSPAAGFLGTFEWEEWPL